MYVEVEYLWFTDQLQLLSVPEFLWYCPNKHTPYHFPCRHMCNIVTMTMFPSTSNYMYVMSPEFTLLRLL